MITALFDNGLNLFETELFLYVNIVRNVEAHHIQCRNKPISRPNKFFFRP